MLHDVSLGERKSPREKPHCERERGKYSLYSASLGKGVYVVINQLQPDPCSDEDA